LCRLADLEERARSTRIRLGEVTAQIATLQESAMQEKEIVAALAAFDPVWDALSPRERARLVESLIERVDFDGENGSVSMTLHPTGIRALESLVEAKA
jgi:site-specific DNA recombinase